MLQIDALTSILIHFMKLAFCSCSCNSYYILIMIIFMQKCTIININCQHNAYLESIKMSIIGRKLGKCQKHNEQILEHNILNLSRSIITCGSYVYKCLTHAIYRYLIEYAYPPSSSEIHVLSCMHGIYDLQSISTCLKRVYRHMQLHSEHVQFL